MNVTCNISIADNEKNNAKLSELLAACQKRCKNNTVDVTTVRRSIDSWINAINWVPKKLLIGLIVDINLDDGTIGRLPNAYYRVSHGNIPQSTHVRLRYRHGWKITAIYRNDFNNPLYRPQFIDGMEPTCDDVIDAMQLNDVARGESDAIRALHLTSIHYAALYNKSQQAGGIFQDEMRDWLFRVNKTLING